MINAVASEAYWKTRLRKLHTRAKECLCGCGERVLVSLAIVQDTGVGKCLWIPKYKGGHEPTGPCACGCGISIPLVNARGLSVRYAPRHAGGYPGPRGPRLDWEQKLQDWNSSAPMCACGCGLRLFKELREGGTLDTRVSAYILGHNNRRGRLTDLSVTERAVILGTLLGDTSICRAHRTSTPRLSFTHGLIQKEYALHKIEVLHRLSWWWEECPNEGYGEVSIRGSSSCIPALEGVLSLVRPGGGVKTVTQGWLDQLDARSLAYWYMDDGSISKSFIALHTEGYTEAENHLVAGWFSQKGYPGVRVATYREYFYIYFPREAALRFLSEVTPYLCPSMQYKGVGL